MSSLCTSVNPKTDGLYTDSSVLYDAVYSEYYYKKKARQINQTIVDETTTNFLDIGCGTGDLQEKLSEKTELTDIYGIDISHPMVELADEINAGNVSVANANSLPFQANSLDSVGLIGDVIGYVNSVSECFSEVNRILSTNGGVFITYFRWPATEITNSLSGVTRDGKSISGSYEAAIEDEKEQTVTVTFDFETPDGTEITEKTTLRCYDEKYIEQKLRQNGFSTVQVHDDFCTHQVDTVTAFV